MGACVLACDAWCALGSSVHTSNATCASWRSGMDKGDDSTWVRVYQRV